MSQIGKYSNEQLFFIVSMVANGKCELVQQTLRLDDFLKKSRQNQKLCYFCHPKKQIGILLILIS
jgi:hypothetical protein